MPGFWKWLESRSGRIVSGVTIVVYGILTWVGAEVHLSAGASYLRQVWTVAWGQRSLDALIGIVLFTLGVFLALWYALPPIVRLFRKRPLYPYVPLALGQASRSVRRQMENAISNARPEVCARRDLGLWERLAAAALAGQAHGDVIEAHCQGGIRSRPVIFGNFRGYAHAVRAVLNELPQLGLHLPYPRVWTLLKRSVFEWYNPFPLICDEFGTRGRVTFTWWEDYKNSVAMLKTAGTINMCRLVAHPMLSAELGRIEEYRLYSNSALDLAEARNAAAGHAAAVTWLPWVQAVLTANNVPASGTSIHLIGKPNGAAGSAGSQVVERFASVYHSGYGRFIDERGVFLRYLQEKSSCQSLLEYDDIFIVELSGNLVFGLAFIDDESLDINGMRILSPHQLSTAARGGAADLLLNNLVSAWNTGQRDFCECNGLLT